MRAVPKVSLRTLGVQIRVKFRLSGDGSLFIFTRGAINDPATTVCRIQKDTYSQNVKLSFGAPIGPGSELKYFKEIDFPDIPDLVDEDSVDLSVCYTDNGDDRV